MAVKKEAKEPTLEGVLVTAASKDLLAQEPMKAFMLRVQHRLRAHIAQVNAWPRKQGNSIEKREVPEAMITQTLRQNAMYQTREFSVQMPEPSTDPSVCGRILSARPCSLTVASSGWQIRDGRSTGRSLQTSRPTSGGWGPTPRPCARRTWSCSTSTACHCRAT